MDGNLTAEWWSYFAFPFNLLLGVILLLGTVVLHFYYRERRWVKWLSSIYGTLWMLGILILFLLGEGLFAGGWYQTGPFVLIWGIVFIQLGLVILRRLRPLTTRNILFLFNHVGLWFVIGASFLGAPDRKTLKMIVPLHRSEYQAVDSYGRLYPLPFTITLEDFTVEYYAGGVPRRFCSELTLTKEGELKRVNVEVNEPASFGGFKIYQDNYDRQGGRYSVLMLVKDPWLGVVYAGIFMVMAGAIGLMIYGPLTRERVRKKNI